MKGEIFNTEILNPISSTIFVQSCTKDHVLKIINQLKSKTSSGLDEISNSIIKFCKEEIAEPLKHIFNLVISTGEYPLLMKITKSIV